MNDRQAARPPRAGPASRTPTMIWIVALGLVITLAAMFFVWQRYQFVRLGFEVGVLRERHAELQDRLTPLEVEAEYLARPERIGQLARERLGLRPPRLEQVILIDLPEPSR